MESDEFVILIVALGVALFATPFALGWLLHRLFLKSNAAAGVPIIAVCASMVWIGFVLRYYADPSVDWIYATFYFIIGLAIVVGPGFWAPRCYGLRVSVDVFQRKNMAVAIVVGAFAFTTAMIYGGSLWGEADPVGDDEGGWWIPLGFFSAAWVVLVLIVALYLRGERFSLRTRLVQDRSLGEARAASSYLLSTGIVLTDAVAGDFWGWWQGMLGLVTVALMMFTHELFRRSMPAILTTVEARSYGWLAGRHFESLAYLCFGIAFWILQFAMRVWTEIPMR